MPLISVGPLFAERFGSGPPTVLALHGWGRRGSDFAASMDGFDALAPDLPGFGASPPPSEVMGAAGYAEMIREIFDEFDRPPVVVGHSFGGRVAVVAQAQAPQAAGLVLVGSPLVRLPSRRRPPLAYRLVRWGNRLGVVSDARLEAEKRRRGSADYRAATGVMRDILVKVVNESYEQELARIDAPVRLVWGEDDAEVPVETARRAAGLLGGPVEMDVLPGVGHHVPWQAPEAIASAVTAMLAAR